MSTATAHQPHDPSRAFIDLAHQLLAVLRAGAPDAATALDALIHTYVAIVQTHPQLGTAAQRSLISASRALLATNGARPTLPPSTAFH